MLKKIQKKYKNLIYTVGQEVMLFNMRKQGWKGGRIEPDFNGPYTIQAISGKLVTLLNSDGVPLKTKYNVDHLKPFLRPKSEDKEGDDKVMETPKGHSCTNTPLQRPSVITFAPEVLKDNTMVTIEVMDACLYHILKNQHKSICQICAVVATTLFNGKIEKLGKDIFPEDIWVCPINFGQHWILVLFLMKGYDGRQSNTAKRGILRVVKRRMWLKFQHKPTVLQMQHCWSDLKRRREGFLRTVCCRIPATSGGRRPQVTLTISPAGRPACLSYVAAGAPNFQQLKVINGPTLDTILPTICWYGKRLTAVETALSIRPRKKPF